MDSSGKILVTGATGNLPGRPGPITAEFFQKQGARSAKS